MAVETVTVLTELTSPAANDEIGIWDVSAGEYKRIQQSNLVGATITGGGTLATGGYTLTVPATGTAALLGTLNTFVKKQTIAPDSNALALQVDMPSGLVNNAALYITRNAGAAVEISALSSGYNYLYLYAGDTGTGVGQFVQIGRNNNASTPAAGHVAMEDKGATYYYVWPDDSGNLRIHTSAPTNGGDTAGTVVGAQSSSLDAKDIQPGLSGIDEVLERIAIGAGAVRRFAYKSGAFGGEEFQGVVVDFAPEYGMDRDEAHPAGRSLNEINVIGDLLRAVAHLTARVAALEAAQA